MSQKDSGRKDHILPVGYLEGFTNPDGYLQVFHIEEKRWFPDLPKNVAWQHGYYDYSEGVTPDQTADQAFHEYETQFPALRRELIAAKFVNWTKHQDFLIRYVNMIRVRTPLFREQYLKALEQFPPMIVDEVLQRHPHPDQPGMERIQVRVKPLPQEGKDLENAHRDISISKMRSEMQSVPKQFYALDWCLRFTNDHTKPIITADDAIRLEGPDWTKYDLMKHMDTLIVFPICWQACLIGKVHKQTPRTRALGPERLAEFQKKFLGSVCRFAYSPVRL